MSDRTNITYIRITNRLEVTRSPVDGKWRAHGFMVDPTLSHDEAVELHEQDLPLPMRWVTLGVATKAKDAIAQAQSILG
jgi:hypothetical protein